MVQDGIELFDKGEYENAIAVYKNALKKNPENITAMYELALTYTTIKEYKLSYDLCIKIMDYKTDIVRQALMIAGTDLDELGRPREAITFYESGIKKYPKDLMLHFNLAITHIRLGENEKAKKTLKKALLIRPTHPSSHLALAGLFMDEGNRIPAILAYTRFLMLEPNSTRSTKARERLRSLVAQGVSEDKSKPNQINITMNPSDSTNEGNFTGVTFMLSLTTALQVSKMKEGKSEKDAFVEIFKSLFSILEETKQQDKKGFTWEFYAPFFTELEKQGFVSVLVDDLFQYNTESFDPVLKWSENYSWPTNLE